MLQRLVRILATAYLSYLALCLLVLMPVMNALAPRLVEQSTARTLSSELILFNPFTLTLEMHDMALSARNEGESALVGFDRARVNLSTASLWNAGIVLDEILLHGLAVHVRRFENGDFNASDLMPTTAPEDTAVSESETANDLPAFTVRRIDFQADHLEFTDESRSPAYNTYSNNLAFTVRDLSSVREIGSPYRLSVIAEHGGRLDWRGQLSLATQQSEGEIELKDIDLRPVYRYLAAGGIQGRACPAGRPRWVHSVVAGCAGVPCGGRERGAARAAVAARRQRVSAGHLGKTGCPAYRWHWHR